MLSIYGCLRVVTTTPFPLLLSVLSRVTPQFINLWVSSSEYGCSRVSFFTINFRVGGLKKSMRFIAYSVWSLCSPIGISEKLLVRRAALYTHVDYIKGCCAIFSTYINSREGQHFSPCLGCQYIQTLFEGGRIKGRELSAFKPISFNL